MNRFEYLYHKKQLLEKKIAKNDLFKLGTKDAIQCVMIKVGMLYSFFTVGDYNKKQQYMKKLIKTNATDIDEITFFQESLKWICRLVLCQDLVQVKMSFSHSNLPAIPKLPVDTILQNHRVTYNRNDYEFVWYYKTFPSIQIPGGMHVCNC